MQDIHDLRFKRAALVIMVFFAVICVIPFFLMIGASLSSERSLTLYGYKFWPKEFSLVSYIYLWHKRGTLVRCYIVSILVTFSGTLINLSLTTLLAYPLSRSNFKGRNLFAFIVYFTMVFNGGATAWYIVWSRLFHIQNTFWALLLPNLLMNGFNVLLTRNYFRSSIPEALIEVAKIDGAGEFTILRKIVLPLSQPVIATVALFSALAYWNDWINGMYFISKPEYYNINIYLTKLLENIQVLKNQPSLVAGISLSTLQLPSVGVRMAVAVVAVIPILLLYPFLQKYLIKGVVIGAVKG